MDVDQSGGFLHIGVGQAGGHGGQDVLRQAVAAVLHADERIPRLLEEAEPYLPTAGVLQSMQVGVFQQRLQH